MRLMLDMRGRAVNDMFAVQSHRAVAILAPKLTGAVVDGICDARDHPFPTLHSTPHEQFFHFTLVDILSIRHITLSTL